MWVAFKITTTKGVFATNRHSGSSGEGGEDEAEDVVSITENQFGSLPPRSTTEAIHPVSRLMKQYSERKRDLHTMFIDLEKAYNKVREAFFFKMTVVSVLSTSTNFHGIPTTSHQQPILGNTNSVCQS